MSRRRPLKREEMPWGLVWTGTVEQLAEAGVIAADQLTGHILQRVGRGRRRPVVLLPSGRYARVGPPSKSGRIEVWEEYTNQEAEAHAAAHEVKQRIDDERKQWGTPAAARTSAERFLREGQAALVVAFNLARSKDRRHRFDEDTRARALECLLELEALFAEGTLTVTPLPRVQEPGFETFLQKLLPGAEP